MEEENDRKTERRRKCETDNELRGTEKQEEEAKEEKEENRDGKGEVGRYERKMTYHQTEKTKEMDVKEKEERCQRKK